MNRFVNEKAISRELLIEINNFGIITEITPNCFNMLGYADTEMLNTNISNYLNYTFDDLSRNKNFNAQISKKDGIKLFFDVHATPLIINNRIKGISLSLIDISKYKEFENKPKMILKMFEHTRDIISRFEIIPKPKFTYLNSSVEDILGYPLEEYIKNPMLPFEITHPDDKEIQFSKIKDDTDFSKIFQVRMKHKDGYYVWVEDYIFPEYNEQNQLIACESITRNIQERKELELRLKKLGYKDYLTGLFNRNYFLKEMNSLNNKNIPIGIFLCDLDNLKFINDSLGHSMGDKLIKSTGKILRSVFDNKHIISRPGGDEFVIFVKNKAYIEVERLYNKLQIAIEQYNENNSDMRIEISIGLAYSDTSLNKMESTLDIADKKMYKNKKQKKSKII